MEKGICLTPNLFCDKIYKLTDNDDNNDKNDKNDTDDKNDNDDKNDKEKMMTRHFGAFEKEQAAAAMFFFRSQRR